jgi:FAD/FMN-containing dehydrogenase/Fe-S oxidoreductase
MLAPGPPVPASRRAEELAATLRAQIRGEVRFDAGSRALYATDGSNYRQVPIGVVIPRDAEDVERTIAVCRERGAPILPRGGGTSLAGQCCNIAVVLDMSKYMNRVLEIDPAGRSARVQPGAILDHLRTAAEEYHLTFAPDPATHNRCTLGGMIGNNACGVHSVMAGKTDDNVEELDILTYDGLRLRVGPTSDQELDAIIRAGGRRGEIYGGLRALRDRYAGRIRTGYPHIPRCVSGYNLPELLPEHGFNVARALVGTEGTCVTILEAKLRLVHSPPVRALVVLGYSDIYVAADQVPQIVEYDPIGLEGFDGIFIEDMRKKHLHLNDVALLPPGNGWLLVEFGGENDDDVAAAASRLLDDVPLLGRPAAALFLTPAEQHQVWTVREASFGATTQVPGKGEFWPGWEDSAVAPEVIGPYLRDLRALLDRYGYGCSFYGHFGQGCVHLRIDFDLVTAAGIREFRAFMSDAADLVVSYGGALSGEHGDGQARAELLPRMFGEELVQAFGEFKRIWDPEGKMNPGKVVDPLPLDADLRLGTAYRPPNVETHFQFPVDGGSFAAATRRCVGVGKCRRLDTGTMCPSFMVTREEADSTRGRAHLLFEMLERGPLRDGWRDEHVKDALDLCLACKGCKNECPVGVDMATYKAEFLSHYWAGRVRPRSAYAFGLVYRWAALASHAPHLVNALAQAPGLNGIVKRLAGMSRHRDIPRFAPQPFTTWFQSHAPRHPDGPLVVLWPDTFNNYFQPENAIAAVEVLEAAGFQVCLPRRRLCCGRPLYDHGMLDTAKGLLRTILATLRPEIEAGIPVVGLEPSCIAVFRDELSNLFPEDKDAERLAAQSFLFSEFLVRYAPELPLQPVPRPAMAQIHCQQNAVMGSADEVAMMERVGLDVRVPDSGCCGMAGSFGFESDHYDVSIACGERVLLPIVRDATDDTLLIANGFSCREQIKQTTGRQAMHLAQVVRAGLA